MKPKKIDFFLFQVLTLVIFFGLFHGLVFFPALLGLLGPSAYSHDDDQVDNNSAGKPTTNTIAESTNVTKF